MKKITWAFVCLFMYASTPAQTSVDPPRLPDWVYMIDNPSVNYFEAVKSFNDYWKGRVKPVEEMDSDDDAEQEKKELREYLGTLSPAERNYWDQLQYHFKRFKQWKKESLTYVQPDGSILNQAQREAIWYKQQEESKQLKK